MNNKNNDGFGLGYSLLTVAGVLGLFFGSYTIVGSGERGVVTHLGAVQQDVLDSGFHFKLPFVTSVHKISVRIQKSDIKTEASSKDMQKVLTEFNINWHPTPAEVNMMFQQTGDEDDVVTNILSPAVAEVLKATTAKLTAEEIISKRLQLKDEIDETLRARVTKYHVVIDDINLVNLAFSDEFNHAIEQKQIAEQRALQARYDAEKAKRDAEAAVNKAEGDAASSLKLAQAQAEGQKLMQRTITPEILQLEFYKKWNGQFPEVLVSGSSGGMPLMFNMPLRSSHSTPKSAE
jgi:prohibitin 1